MTTSLHGLTLYVARAADGDWSLGGITSRHPELCVIGIRDHTAHHPDPLLRPRSWQVTTPRPDKPAVVVHIAYRFSLGPDRHTRGAYLEPALLDGAVMPGSFAYGGNFAGTSDARFAEQVAALLGYPLSGPLPVRDRVIDPRPQQ